MPKSRMMQFRSGTGSVAGLLIIPAHRERRRAVILIHEWWGLTPWVKSQASSLAENGYGALAVDLYHKKVTSNPAWARKLKRGLFRASDERRKGIPRDQNLRGCGPRL